MYDIIMTTDRTMMSNHWGKEFMGFGTTGPPKVIPEWMWLLLFAPPMKTDRFGRPWQAPYGMRKIEAKLIDCGYKATIIDPSKLGKYVKSAKLLLLSHHDYFGFCPPSSTFASIFKTETVNARSFKRLMESPAIRAMKKRGVKIIAGGPAAWHWRHRKDLMKKWGVDCVVEGEGERIICNLVEKALNGEELPEYVVVKPKESPCIDEISDIKAPSVNGLVEVMRGCPRGCKFCSVTLRPLRFIPFDKIEREILVNVRRGVRDGIMHSEDVLLYGANGVIPKETPLINLHKLFKKYYRKIAWAHASIAAIVKAERDSKLITKISEIVLDDEQEWWGAEIGIETGSPQLAEKIMPAKAKPFSTKEWPEIVVEAASIMEDVNLIPAMTIIVGLPEETEKDVEYTLQLIEELWDFRAIIMPMFFVPMGMLSNKDWFRAYEVTDLHKELLTKCLTHGVRMSKEILKVYLKDKWYQPALLPFLGFFIGRVEKKAKRLGYWSDRGKRLYIG